jgi:hypothetical protein
MKLRDIWNNFTATPTTWVANPNLNPLFTLRSVPFCALFGLVPIALPLTIYDVSATFTVLTEHPTHFIEIKEVVECEKNTLPHKTHENGAVMRTH